ncbi:hypothetical protein [Streptomyces chromofuscus]|uniref:Integral membrane protein n=1 Tax=Streptomyces chromofuscus TaxID=42881 RepID=A0A7M2T878_STRCW|nr:hypothetical protein [Streptomyces chromofuscus]QOV44772.1 hypothetical protein IPT68_01755 [Streptomyces chromofuscus]GGT00349.1 hypothetical protein GCM10010254_20550 [Streptomyces chromofuscus]
MSPAVITLLLLAGVSEAAGRIVPLAVRRPGVSRTLLIRLLIMGGVVEAVVFGLWPLTAWTLAGLLLSSPLPGYDPLWTPGLVAPLVFAAVLAFPMLGPLLHVLLLVGVGLALTDPFAAATGVDRWTAAGCLALSGVGLAVAVEAVRRLVVRLSVPRAPEPVG